MNEPARDRGQVGIGTLIVFISMVLVAAIAAGVLINTAGVLQSQAEATGEESTAQIANSIQVFSATGEANDGEVDEPDIIVGLGPGSDAIDLDEIVIEAVGDNGRQTFAGTDSDISREAVSGDNDDILESSSDRVKITLEEVTLAEGEETELIITTGDGSQTTERLSVPDILSDGESVRL